jgi:HD-GYP domain-containing protein (c-di-GMP phosphodiesterase class II)
VRLSDVLAGLSVALDLTEGQRPGHSVRSCAIGMRLAETLGLSQSDRSSLFYALLMKDLGCSSNASRFAALFAADDHVLKSTLVKMDWSQPLESFRFVATSVAPGRFWLRRVWQALAVFSRGPEGAREVVRTRCERGADIARMLGFADATVEAIRALDEHWDGKGQAYALKGEQIPLLGRILNISQTVEVFFSEYGVLTAYDVAEQRSGTWFDPDLVAALRSIRRDSAFWRWLAQSDAIAEIGALEPEDQVFTADEDRLDLVAEAFARVIDAKSPWTYKHSNGVAALTTAIASVIGVPESERRELTRAALLHDLGKLGVSSLILDKPGKLTDEEFAVIKRHPEHTHSILSRVGCFAHLADLASSHHERLDGRGYHRGRRDRDLTTNARIICVADICDALRQSRPYREGLASERILEIMQRDSGSGLDADCLAALEKVLHTDSTAPGDGSASPARLVPALSEDYQQAA